MHIQRGIILVAAVHFSLLLQVRPESTSEVNSLRFKVASRQCKRVCRDLQKGGTVALRLCINCWDLSNSKAVVSKIII